MVEKAAAERAELENMADHLRGIPCNPRAESVNLDNLFDFLADVPAQRGAPDGQPDHQPSIAEIGDCMERLADDLNHEVTNILHHKSYKTFDRVCLLKQVQLRNLFQLETVLAEEMIELNKAHTEAQRKPDGAPSESIPPPTSLALTSILHPATPVTPNPLTNGVSNGMSPVTLSSSITNGLSPTHEMTSSLTNGDVMSSSLVMPPPPSIEPSVEDSPVFPPPPSCSLPEPAGPPPPPPLIKGILYLCMFFKDFLNKHITFGYTAT